MNMTCVPLLPLPEANCTRVERILSDNLLNAVERAWELGCICIALFGMLLHTVIIIISHWIPRPLNGHVRLCLSLSTVDLIASGANATLLLCSYQKRSEDCWLLLLETVRMSMMLASVYHVMAIACAHLYAVTRPLYARQKLTQQRINVLCIACNAFAIAVESSLYMSTGYCWAQCFTRVQANSIYRAINLGIFVVPVFVTLLAYAFMLARMSVRRRRSTMLLQQTTLVNLKDVNNYFDNYLTVFTQKGNTNKDLAASTTVSCVQSLRDGIFAGGAFFTKADVRLALTTLMLAGSVVTGWLVPPIIYLCVCKYPLSSATMSTHLHGVLWLLIVGKLLVDALIYAWRSIELHYAWWRLRVAIAPSFYANIEPPAKFSQFNPQRSAYKKSQLHQEAARAERRRRNTPEIIKSFI